MDESIVSEPVFRTSNWLLSAKSGHSAWHALHKQTFVFFTHIDCPLDLSTALHFITEATDESRPIRRAQHMFSISELAESVGLSRTTLLYYEKIGLLKGRRQENGYRVYSDADRQRLQFMQQLQAGGLSLRECQECMEGKVDRDMLQQRLRTLDDEIDAKRRSRDLLAALLGRSSLKAWHEEIERVAPDIHHGWLMTQGFSSKEVDRVVWLSKDMNEHEHYMAAFMEVFSELEYWGPGSREATLKALSLLPFRPQTIFEIGCGNGVATMLLAAQTRSRITAIDTDEAALARLRQKVFDSDHSARIEARCLDMRNLPAPDQPYDLIWAEGSAYIMGVEQALKAWSPLLRPGGALVLSDMVWRTDSPSASVRAFWASEYPAMATASMRLEQAKLAGYRLLGNFDMGKEAMDTYYCPLAARVDAVSERMDGQRVLDDLREELRTWREGSGQFSFEMFVLQRP